MLKYGTNIRLSFLLKLLLLVSVGFFMNCCNHSAKKERYISFDEGWRIEPKEQSNSNIIIAHKQFDLPFQKENAFVLQFSPEDSIVVLRVNNHLVQKVNYSAYYQNYNITSELYQNDEHNMIDLEVVRTRKIAPASLDTLAKLGMRARLLCVNKFFIPDVEVSLHDVDDLCTKVIVKVKIKNFENIEQQGVLKCTIYSLGKVLQSKDTPVFLSGNAENTYNQPFLLTNQNSKNQNIVVKCGLYSKDVLLDEYSSYVR